MKDEVREFVPESATRIGIGAEGDQPRSRQGDPRSPCRGTATGEPVEGGSVTREDEPGRGFRQSGRR